MRLYENHIKVSKIVWKCLTSQCTRLLNEIAFSGAALGETAFSRAALKTKSSFL